MLTVLDYLQRRLTAEVFLCSSPFRPAESPPHLPRHPSATDKENEREKKQRQEVKEKDRGLKDKVTEFKLDHFQQLPAM